MDSYFIIADQLSQINDSLASIAESLEKIVNKENKK